MADEIGKLLKNEDSSSQIKPAASLKKTKRIKKKTKWHLSFIAD